MKFGTKSTQEINSMITVMTKTLVNSFYGWISSRADVVISGIGERDRISANLANNPRDLNRAKRSSLHIIVIIAKSRNQLSRFGNLTGRDEADNILLNSGQYCA
uniref:Uncharacterized protein n=1 Tax=Glossina austeni TaxID=7395 RepID=A0A1A9V5T8_GLOAU